MRPVRLLLTVLFCLLPTLAWADSAGSALGVDPDADAALKGASRTLVVGSDIFIGDTVNTGPAGQVQILFADNTKLVIGPNSSLLIEDYLIRNDGSAGQFAINMLSGVFRFATGDSAKNRYRIDTPTGTIGVRGTWFEVRVDHDTHETFILLLRGIVDFCTGPGHKVCQQLADQCAVGHMDGSQADISGDARDSVGEEHKKLRQDFRYAANDAGLKAPFRFVQAYACLNKDPKVPGPKFDSGVGSFTKPEDDCDWGDEGA
jgi:hypothetical protein